MLALIDKNILALLVVPLKADLGISDTEIGLVIGLAFALANLGIVLPAGWMVDRYNRKSIVAAGVALWSLFAVGCGMARGFGSLFLCRAGVGMSEGLIPPAAYSLIRDGVTPHRRARALSIFSMAQAVGTGLALALGGLLYGLVASLDFSDVPFFRNYQPWAITIILVGLAGFPFCLLLLGFKEPARGGAKEDAGVRPLREAWLEIKGNSRVYLPLLLFSVAQAMTTVSYAAWQPAFMGRKFDLTPAEIGVPLGLLLMTVAPLGLLVVGFALDRLQRVTTRSYAIVAIVASVVTAPAAVYMAQAPTPNWTWFTLGVYLTGSTAYLVIVATAVAAIANPANIGKTMAIFLFFQAGAGSGLAPVIVPSVAAMMGGSLTGALSLLSGIYGAIAIGAAIWLYAVTGGSHRRAPQAT
jgi:hypothetical protein